MIPNRPFLSWLLKRHHAQGALTEIRALRIAPDGQRGVWSGYFGPEHLELLLTCLAPLPSGPRTVIPPGDHPRSTEANVYFSMQGVDPDDARGSVGRISRASQTTRDSDILVYGLFAVDLDPVRPSGVSATDEEKAEARFLAERIRDWFSAHDVQAHLADSGNGYHLLIPVKPQRDAAVTLAALKAHTLLRMLDARFSSDRVKVDTSIFNPARILKLYGTLAMKGDPTPTRPHRASWVDWPHPVVEVPLFEMLGDEMRAFYRSKRKPAPSRPSVVEPSACGIKSGVSDQGWQDWRRRAIAVLDLKQVYGDLLTGRDSSPGWRECRDPASPTGDQHPSAGVADGTAQAERGTFHSFRTGETLSVFDFLYTFGGLADFAGARAWVAQATGVALPGDGSRSAARVLEQIPPMTEPPDADTNPDGNPTVDESLARAVVDFITNLDPVASLFDRLLDALLPLQRLFSAGGGLVWVEPGRGTCPVTERILPGLLSGHIDLRLLRHTGKDVSFTRYGVLPYELARTFVADPRVRAAVPPLVLYTRSPLFTPDWSFIGTPGYHPECGGLWYDGPEVTASRCGSHRLIALLKTFNFHGAADLVNTLGVLLTALTLPHWGRGHPFVALNGNKPGCGKTTLARLLGAIADGSEPATVTWTSDDAELEKQLATRVEAGDRFIVLDNVKARTALSSPVLERSITDGRPSFRRLGTNTVITRATNDLVFCLTMNDTRLGPDLRRRAQPINLVLEKDVRDACYRDDDIVGRALAARPALLGEVAGLVHRWLKAGRPLPLDPARHSASQPWATTLDAILRHSGFNQFLTNLDDAERAFDPDYDLMSDIATRCGQMPPAFAAEWVSRMEETGLDDLFRDAGGREKTARGKATAIGQLFAGRLGQVVEAEGVRYRLIRRWPRGEGWKAEYGFEVL